MVQLPAMTVLQDPQSLPPKRPDKVEKPAVMIVLASVMRK